ncbi:putative nucleic acid-binding protein [Rhizobium aquaticum]|uniref:Ribonuclease VapC n=1 Tax=Rhizobium aquaticum TaxID=1549636 RepID=A0ABV2J0L7_9HYPH
MIFLDTNVLSDFARRNGDPIVRAWFLQQRPEDLVVSSVVVMEMAFGAERIWLRDGSGRFLVGLKTLIETAFAGRIYDLNLEASLLAGKLRAQRERDGRPLHVQDAMIAAICAVHGGTLATRNIKDFEGLDLSLVNPFEER